MSAALLAGAGVYQLMPLKHACLTRCRSPVAFLVGRRRSGVQGALELGISHGLWCVACSAALMVLLFVGGIMNLVWIAALTVIVLVEKLLPDPRPFSIGVGVLCLIAAAYIVITIGMV